MVSDRAAGRAQTTPHRDRERAQVVLAAADGVAGIQIAR